jgi:hypothetical protein
MARIYKVNGKIMSGSDLVKVARREFRADPHGLGRYSRPTTVKKAVRFMGNYVKADVVWRRETETEWKSWYDH